MSNPVKQWLVPVVVETFDSNYNHDVQLVKYMGNLRLDMGGLTQSGDIITSIWKKAIKTHLAPDFHPQNILVLGLGGGSVIHLLQRLYPDSAITAVEIDPVVINIAKKYFFLDQVKNLTVIRGDAVQYIQHLPQDNYFDLVLVDCYLGHQIPKELSSVRFIKKVKKHCQFLLINRIFWDKYKQEALTFINSLSPHFSITTCRTPSNLVLSISVIIKPHA